MLEAASCLVGVLVAEGGSTNSGFCLSSGGSWPTPANCVVMPVAAAALVFAAGAGLDAGDMPALATALMQDHYDPAYQRSRRIDTRIHLKHWSWFRGAWGE